MIRKTISGSSDFNQVTASQNQALAISDLKKIYAGEVVALKGISFTVNKRDFFGLLGPNGAGKTTVIGIISSLVNKTSGEVSIFGHSIDKEPVIAKRFIGLVPQEFNFNMFEKVIDVTLNQAGYYGLKRSIAISRAEKYLSKLGLWEKRNEISRNLSGGMKRRLMIARALIHEPELLILDEPTAGVDIELRRSMWHFLEEINAQGTTIILTTHYLEEAEYLCKQIAIINKGEIIENTSKRELLGKLNKVLLILDLKEPVDIVPVCDKFLIEKKDNDTLEVQFSKEENIHELFSFLAENNIHVHSVRNKTSRLEELFLTLVKEQENDS